MKESLFTETEPAQALREIRARYPGFDMAAFVKELRGDVPLVIKAYLDADLATLREHCSKEMMERFSGMIAAQKAEVMPWMSCLALHLPLSVVWTPYTSLHKMRCEGFLSRFTVQAGCSNTPPRLVFL